MSNLLKDATATLNELLRMHDLNRELLETLQVTMLWLRDYAEKNNLPLPNGSTYNSLINKAQVLIDELTSSDGFLQRKKSDKDFTEPEFSLYNCV